MAMTSDSGRGFTQQELDEFLTTGRLFAKVATVNEEGWPQISPVWYSWDGSAFLIISKARTGMVKNLRRDPRCGLLVDNYQLPYARVSVQGEAEFLPEDFDYVPPMREMVLRYLGPEGMDYAERTMVFPRVPFRVLPRKLASWNGGGFDRTFQRDTVWKEVRA
ncbi:MAG TPA: TIGR03618 family F420-dependent PPOX class oxidoreductase [Geodermatophilus sp.]|nr:TIGR03618 family F420-dependent PPOX class oxidoreductase [Geodermatophilus sp.]